MLTDGVGAKLKMRLFKKNI